MTIATPGTPATYELRHPLDGSSWSARENVADILSRELLGPANGPTEIVREMPKNLYLVGLIAPTKLSERGDALDADGEDVVGLGDSAESQTGRGVPITSVDEQGIDGDDDEADDAPVRRGLMIPASMGLRCQVPATLPRVDVHVSYGRYKAETLEPDPSAPEGARPQRAYRRVPYEATVSVRLDDLTVGATSTYPVEDATGGVVLRVDRFDSGDQVILEIALCNDLEVPARIPSTAWLYQTRLEVTGDGDCFLPVADAMLSDPAEADDEALRLALQYRHRLEFAVGRVCSVDWDVAPGERRATAVRTTWLPVVETPQTRSREVAGAMLDMRELAAASADALVSGLTPIAEAYEEWLTSQKEQVQGLPAWLQEPAEEALVEASQALAQLREGIEFLAGHDEARRCFAFMNSVMADQRVHSQVAELRKASESLSLAAATETVEQRPGSHQWRTFQLAFVLMQLKALWDPTSERRSSPDLAKVQLLFFPTGGGKTEAYLGLAAYTFAVRRRQGVITTDDGPIDGRSGVAVLMRYTLRLLTSQQFQRAATLVCAAELERRRDPATWGEEPFRIGLWVGLDVTPKYVADAADQIAQANEQTRRRLPVLQVKRCPWCGTRIEAKHVRADLDRTRVFVRCGDPKARCPFSEGGSVADGLPILTVDEEIYHLAPAFLIATVDKFARLAREGAAASLLGYVREWCPRHGYTHDDDRSCSSSHNAKAPLPAAKRQVVDRLRTPDLVIQDELHLITGSLGTTVGLFETAIDVLCSWRTSDGRPVQPLVVASSATVRQARDQVHDLYGRGVTMFPPQVLDASDTFFSLDVPVTRETPGRRYVGVSASGVRMVHAEIRVAEVLLAAGQTLLDREPADAASTAVDPYLTLVGYFSTTRELAGMNRYLKDDIYTATSRGRRGIPLSRRYGTLGVEYHLAELTARASGADIGETLDDMAVAFDPRFDSSGGRAALRATDEKDRPSRKERPFDAILATSMLQVGVDVSRLGLMVMVGQPKNTAEYIQASSRVGRDATRPGLVVTIGNWARPRDLAHFEQFRHYHETFYAQVEPLSVTPFSPTAIERGLDAVLVSAARVVDAVAEGGLSPQAGADHVDARASVLSTLVGRLRERAARAAYDDAPIFDDRLLNRLDAWKKHRASSAKQLVYDRPTKPDLQTALMVSSEEKRLVELGTGGPPFEVPNSMREVQREINVLVSPLPDRMLDPSTRAAVAPAWLLPAEVDHE